MRPPSGRRRARTRAQHSRRGAHPPGFAGRRRVAIVGPASESALTPGEAFWGRTEQLQRAVYAASRAADSPDAAAAPQAVNLAHVEGVVGDVECGYREHHKKGASGEVRQVVHVTDAVTAHTPLLQLWLLVPEDGRAVPLAVVCPLSDEAVDAAWWRSVPVPDGAEAADAHGHAKLHSYARWARRELRNKRVVFSGVLKEEQMYDAETKTVVTVPVLRLPKDSLEASYTVLP